MSVLFPRFNEFSPFFRLVDELDRATRASSLTSQHPGSERSFAPRFDVKETKEAYELHGELPGIEQSNINIEWVEDNNLTVSGHTENRYESSSGDDAIEVAQPEEGKTEASGADKEKGTAVAKTDKTEIAKRERTPRYWVTERSVGSFHRTFQFPTRVDHDGVKANLKNGILSIVVPKARPVEPRKISIQQ